MRKILFCLVVVVALVLPSDAFATTARRLSNEAMSAAADVIAIGTAIDVRSVWDDRTLVTLVTLKVNESLKGATASTVTIVLPGGIDANRPFPVAMTYAGAPQIGLGEEVFVFLARDEEVQSGLIIVGFSQGKFSIVTNRQGQRLVTRDLSTILLDSGAGLAPGTQSLTSLDEFRAEIAAYLR